MAADITSYLMAFGLDPSWERLIVTRISVKGKCKAIPLQAWTGLEDSRRLRLPDIKTIGT